MAKQTQQLLLMLVIGVLIGTTIVFIWKGDDAYLGANKENSTPENVPASLDAPLGSTPDATIASSGIDFPLPPSIPSNTRAGLSVADQPKGRTVSVTNLNVTETQWLAVYDDRGGKPGWILGATRVHPGDTSAAIELLRADGTNPGGTFYVALLNDDGDDTFNRLTDLPPLSPDKVLIVRFTAQ